MLIFTFNADMSTDARKAAEEFLRERTGENCMVLPMCTGVYEISSVEERLDEGCNGDHGREELTDE